MLRIRSPTQGVSARTGDRSLVLKHPLSWWLEPHWLLKTHERGRKLLIKISKNLALATCERNGVTTVHRAGRRGIQPRLLAIVCPGDRKIPKGLFESLGTAAHKHLPMVEKKYTTATRTFDGVIKLVSSGGEWYMRITDVTDVDTECLLPDTDDLAIWEQAVELVCRKAVADKHPNRSLLKLQIGLL